MADQAPGPVFVRSGQTVETVARGRRAAEGRAATPAAGPMMVSAMTVVQGLTLPGADLGRIVETVVQDDLKHLWESRTSARTVVPSVVAQDFLLGFSCPDTVPACL